MAKVYVKRVPSSEWSRTVWDSATTYNLGDRVSHDDGTANRYYECIKSHSSSTPQTNGDTYWVRIGSSPEFPYHAADGRLDSYTLGDVYLETINTRYTSTTNGVIWNHATELGTTSGEIILEDGEYFQPTSALCADGLDITAENIGKVTINHHYFNNKYILGGSVLTDHRSKITGINLIMGGSGNTQLIESNTKIFFDQCKLTDENCPYGSVTSNDFRIGNANHISFKNTLCYFINTTASLMGNSMKLHEGEKTVWENSTFVINVGTGNNYSRFIFTPSSLVIKRCIFYAPQTNYTNNTLTIDLAGEGESNIFYTLDSNSPTFQENSAFKFLDPGFVDPSKGNFTLRPSSPLIGGVKTGNPLEIEYPEGLWVDSAHIEVNSSYSFSLDVGDGSNYTFSGDATGTDPSINANIRDTLVFTNNTGGHPLAIYNSEGVEVASESSGTTTFTPKYPDTYYYQCTVPGHENMRGNITISMGTLGTESNPFSNYQSAIDARAFTGSCDILFKEGDHPMNSGAGPTGMAFESSYPKGIRFVGSSAKSTRLVSLNTINSWPMFYNNTANLDTNATISGSDFYFINIGIHINNTASYVNRGILGVFKNLTLRGCIFSATSTAVINGSLINRPVDWFDAKGCIFNLPLQKGPPGDMQWIGGSYGITRYRIESCVFLNLSGYYRPTYENNTFFGQSTDANSYFKNSIVYTDIAATTQLISSGTSTQAGTWATNWTGNIYYNSAADFIYTPNVNSGSCIVADPLFVDLTTENEDFRLRANSPGIGGTKKQETGVYYLQPGNSFNGDGSQKDASSMSANGDPGPFNNFKEIIAAGVPYGSKIVILDGTYSWPNEFHQYSVSSSNWQDYSFAGYNYYAETPGSVIFNANRQPKWFHYHAFGGASGAGTYLDLDTEFHGVVFSDVVGAGSTTRNLVTSISNEAGKGSCSFHNCQFLDYFITTGYPFSGGMRGAKSSRMNWYGCIISLCHDVGGGGLFSGGDGMAKNSDHGAWELKNNTIVVQGIGQTTFNGRNAGGTSGVYQPVYNLFGVSYDVSQHLVQGNIIYNPGGNAALHTNANYLPQYKNNLFLGLNVGAHSDTLDANSNLLNLDPKFVDPANFEFKLRPNSPIIGKG